MELTRRDFLKSAAVTAALAASGCSPRQNGGSTADNRRAKEADRWVKGVCRFCGTGCGVLAGVKNNKIVVVKGDPDCEVNKGRLCIKGILLPKIMDTPDRCLHPLIRKDGKLVEASWDEALNLIAEKFTSAVKEFGPDSVGFYGSGQTFAEETFVASKLFRAGFGTNNIDGNPRTCMASAVAGFLTSFGEDEPSGTYQDMEAADTFFFIGSNLAEAHPVLFSRLIDIKNSNPDVKIIVADPRRTRTCDIADYHLPFIPSRDIAMTNSMAYIIIHDGLLDKKFIDDHTEFHMGNKKISFEEYVKFLDDYSPEATAEKTGIPADYLREVTHVFADPKRNTMSLWCMGLNQRSRGVWINNCVHNLHLLTGKICRPGNTPFSLTGQPSACGSVREVGGLSHLLPCHRMVANKKDREEIAKLWNVAPERVPAKAGYHTLAMFDAAVKGNLKCLWVMTTNPGHSLPNLGYYRPGMEKTFLVVSDAYHPTRTTELADVVLPAALWMEKTGIYGNGERRTNLVGQAVPPPGEARSDLEVLVEVTKRCGFPELVPYEKLPDDVFAEYQKCSMGTGMQLGPYEMYKEGHGYTWPVVDGKETYIRYAEPWDPFIKPGEGIKFYGKPNGRAWIWARPQQDAQEMPDDEYPFFLSTGRMLEHWHTGTMTMNVPELKNACPEMWIEVNEDDAKRLGINENDLVDITSRRATCTMKAKINGRGRPRPGMVYCNFHDAVRERMINYVLLDAYDPASKQPEYKICAVKIAKHQ